MKMDSTGGLGLGFCFIKDQQLNEMQYGVQQGLAFVWWLYTALNSIHFDFAAGSERFTNRRTVPAKSDRN